MMLTFVVLMFIAFASCLLQKSTHKANLFLALLRIHLSVLLASNSSLASKDSIACDVSPLRARLSHTRVRLFTTNMTA
jgi:hypothetical protein